MAERVRITTVRVKGGFRGEVRDQRGLLVYTTQIYESQSTAVKVAKAVCLRRLGVVGFFDYARVIREDVMVVERLSIITLRLPDGQVYAWNYDDEDASYKALFREFTRLVTEQVICWSTFAHLCRQAIDQRAKRFEAAIASAGLEEAGP